MYVWLKARKDGSGHESPSLSHVAAVRTLVVTRLVDSIYSCTDVAS